MCMNGLSGRTNLFSSSNILFIHCMSNKCRIEFPICKDHPIQYRNFAVPEGSNIFLKTMSFAISRRSHRLEKLSSLRIIVNYIINNGILNMFLIVLVDYDYMHLFNCFHNIKIHILFIEKKFIYKYFFLFFLQAYECINSRM